MLRSVSRSVRNSRLAKFLLSAAESDFQTVSTCRCSGSKPREKTFASLTASGIPVNLRNREKQAHCQSDLSVISEVQDVGASKCGCSWVVRTHLVCRLDPTPRLNASGHAASVETMRRSPDEEELLRHFRRVRERRDELIGACLLLILGFRQRVRQLHSQFALRIRSPSCDQLARPSL